MIFIKPTKNLIGITIQGDFYDFYEVVDSIHRIVMKMMKERIFIMEYESDCWECAMIYATPAWEIGT